MGDRQGDDDCDGRGHRPARGPDFAAVHLHHRTRQQRGRARARKQAAHALIADLSAEQVQALDQLFDAAGGMSHLALLKTIPVAAKPDHVRQILDRLRQVRKIGISPTSRAASTRTDFGNMSGKAVRRLPI
jgi:hypothetical protein